MIESETDDTPQIESEPFDPHDGLSRGYTLAQGAPRQPTKEDRLRALMFMDIEDACRIADEWGIQEHRGGDGTKPFAGDKSAEIHKEGADVKNYAKALIEDGVPYEVAEHLDKLGLEVMMIGRWLASWYSNGGHDSSV